MAGVKGFIGYEGAVVEISGHVTNGDLCRSGWSGGCRRKWGGGGYMGRGSEG